MRVVFIAAPNAHFAPLMAQLRAGAAAIGDTTNAIVSSYGAVRLPQGTDAAVCWGWRRGAALRRHNPGLPVLVMERGYVGDRFNWTSLGWNGLNRRAVFPKADLHIWRHMMFGQPAPWRDPAAPGYALILGQVPSDQACKDVNLAQTYQRWAHELARRSYQVKFRPHPKAGHRQLGMQRGQHTRGTLAEDLAGAKFTVSWNSNASVDSVLAGVPSVTFDEGAMAWDVTSHSLADPVKMPPRTEWATQLAWCQWQPSELADGTAWRVVREVIPA